MSKGDATDGSLDLTFQYKIMNPSPCNLGFSEVMERKGRRKRQEVIGVCIRIKVIVEWGVFWCFNEKKMVRMIGFMNLPTKLTQETH